MATIAISQSMAMATMITGPPVTAAVTAISTAISSSDPCAIARRPRSRIGEEGHVTGVLTLTLAGKI
jgi:hypothetical protein